MQNQPVKLLESVTHQISLKNVKHIASAEKHYSGTHKYCNSRPCARKASALSFLSHPSTLQNILNGKPIVKGARISVALILQCMASGMSIDDILAGYPTLTREGIEAALDFAARQFHGEEVRLPPNTR
jgi:uncharacterized protein (DUF433 family)